jgi:hypothetical protein
MFTSFFCRKPKTKKLKTKNVRSAHVHQLFDPLSKTDRFTHRLVNTCHRPTDNKDAILCSLTVLRFRLTKRTRERSRHSCVTPCSNIHAARDRFSLVHQARELLSRSARSTKSRYSRIDYGTDLKIPEYQLTRKSQLSSIDANVQIGEIDEVGKTREKNLHFSPVHF